MVDQIKVGILGASPDESWGSTAHIPALKALDQFRLVSICNRHHESTRKAADLFGIPKPVSSPEEMFTDRDIDLVVVCMRVPYHYEVTSAALSHRKHVLCEWPLAVTTEQAIALRDSAEKHCVRHTIGLQARFAPAINYVKDLVADGYVGDVLACTAVFSWPQSTRSAYVQKEEGGATLLSVKGGHTLDAIRFILGDFREISATLETLTKEVTVKDTGETVPRTAYDQIVVSGVLKSGAVFSMQLKGGPSFGTGLRFEINGSKGDLVLTGSGYPTIQITPLTLWETKQGGVLSPVPVPRRYRWIPDGLPSGPPENVAQLYSKLAKSLQGDSPGLPDFSTAVDNHRLLDAVRDAARSGQRVLL